jgi:membrane-bound ClpP family serine protease
MEENMTETEKKSISIKDAIVAVEKCRQSTLISYISGQEGLIGPEDAPMLVDSIEMVMPPTGKIEKLDLFLNSPGGFLDPAYKIVRICKEYSNEFNVIIPFSAKSAATVICLGAKEIVMSSLSELGPIDPIIQHPYKPEVRVPARVIKDFFHFLSSTETEGKIIVDQSFKLQMANLLDPYFIGSYQTALRSSKQIAEILLGENALKGNAAKIKDTSDKLTEYYFSHNFVIDRNEARELGLNVKNAEDDKSLITAIRQLFNIYQIFMNSNNIIKLIGNRELNRNFQRQPQPQAAPALMPQKPVNLTF